MDSLLFFQMIGNYFLAIVSECGIDRLSVIGEISSFDLYSLYILVSFCGMDFARRELNRVIDLGQGGPEG